MALRQFRLTVADTIDDAQADRLFDRADDLSVEVVPGERLAWVAFDREAPTLVDAVVSGVRDLDDARIVIAAALDDDPIVTLEVIAARSGRPPAALRGTLPQPVRAHPRRPVYRWPEVAARLGLPDEDSAATFEAVTLALRLRALAPRLERMPPIRSLLY